MVFFTKVGGNKHLTHPKGKKCGLKRWQRIVSAMLSANVIGAIAAETSTTPNPLTGEAATMEIVTAVIKDDAGNE